jgi:hypothetical protein
LFKLINQFTEPYQKQLIAISNKNTEEVETLIDGVKVKQPKTNQLKVNEEFSAVLKNSEEKLDIAFPLEKDLDPLAVAVKYFTTQIWVNVQVPPTIADGTLFDNIDEKFCEAIPILGKLFKQKGKPVPDER